MMELDTTRRLDIMSALEGDNTTSRQLGNMLARQQTLQVSMTECLQVSVIECQHVRVRIKLLLCFFLLHLEMVDLSPE